MELTLHQIRESGLLEHYVLGELVDSDIRLVESAVLIYPELKEDLNEIEITLFKYADAHKVEPPRESLNTILNKAREYSEPIPNQGKVKTQPFNRILSFGLLASLTSLLYLGYQSLQPNPVLDQIKQELADCKTQTQVLANDLEGYKKVHNSNSKSILIGPTDKYPDTDIIIHINDVKRSATLEIRNLPDLTANQSFQLWSLKPDTEPIPLDVFTNQDHLFVNTQYVSETQAYAITIEKTGGSQVPDLTQLIGVFAIEG